MPGSLQILKPTLQGDLFFSSPFFYIRTDCEVKQLAQSQANPGVEPKEESKEQTLNHSPRVNCGEQ